MPASYYDAKTKYERNLCFVRDYLSYINNITGAPMRAARAINNIKHFFNALNGLIAHYHHCHSDQFFDQQVPAADVLELSEQLKALLLLRIDKAFCDMLLKIDRKLLTAPISGFVQSHQYEWSAYHYVQGVQFIEQFFKDQAKPRRGVTFFESRARFTILMDSFSDIISHYTLCRANNFPGRTVAEEELLVMKKQIMELVFKEIEEGQVYAVLSIKPITDFAAEHRDEYLDELFPPPVKN